MIIEEIMNWTFVTGPLQAPFTTFGILGLIALFLGLSAYEWIKQLRFDKIVATAETEYSEDGYAVLYKPAHVEWVELHEDVRVERARQHVINGAPQLSTSHSTCLSCNDSEWCAFAFDAQNIGGYCNLLNK